jgi:hypothetical protein
VCHQTVCLLARHLEANGTPTLILGGAHDILTAGKAPRMVFLDYPLGHGAGGRGDPSAQYAVTRAALDAFETIKNPGEMITLPNQWHEGESWKTNFVEADSDSRSPRDETPRYQFEEDRIAAEGA